MSEDWFDRLRVKDIRALKLTSKLLTPPWPRGTRPFFSLSKCGEMIEEILEIAPQCRFKVFANRCVRVSRLDLLIGFSWPCATLFEYFVLYW